ncbi:hypothetical protein [[Curtobacterium] plantarum]|uniref:Uncharacterized protein n=1 Tax=[Curtobacterium] plantarum TaxID=221276 RepID=A0ABT9T9D4_9GAMM|nr:hypothetical protein [[Curtobacterium] plantarum]MDQ0020092.1 hypothetical protein [[Curtobacterium] plantarum]
MKKLLSFVGLAPRKDEEEMVEKIKNTYSSLKVVGRGTVTVSADEVIGNPEFRDLYARASNIVARSRNQ